MLVLASQIVEKEQETQMDIDPETLRKFTKDDDKVEYNRIVNLCIRSKEDIKKGKRP